MKRVIGSAILFVIAASCLSVVWIMPNDDVSLVMIGLAPVLFLLGLAILSRHSLEDREPYEDWHRAEDRLRLKYVTAHRLWEVNGGLLQSLTACPDPIWEPKIPKTAICRGRHLAPDWGCTCGIYATKLPPSHMGCVASRIEHVHGLVALWGKIVEHTGGYRAQFAYPLSVYPCPLSPMHPVTGLAHVYGLDGP